MALASASVLNKLISHVKRVGVLKNVLAHEPKSAPPFGTASVFLREVRAIQQGSGLNKTNALVVWNVRLYQNMLKEPQDEIDTGLLDTMDLLLTSFNQDFTLEGAVKSVDILGISGVGLGAEAGYVEIDRKMYRIIDITLPLLMNNVWTQGS